MARKQTKWTLDEEVVIHDMQQAGKSRLEIAQALGRSYMSLDGHLRQSQTNAARRKRRATEVQLYKAHAPVKKIDIPEYVLAERDRRANAPRSLTAMLCGDPPFSQSALAKSPNAGVWSQSEAEKAY